MFCDFAVSVLQLNNNNNNNNNSNVMTHSKVP